ncbi:VWA domain-containing protein [Rhodothermus profundi]|uniref:Ca-activated chloride channel family protein n=1 Tax=Rhodothermus profundi TaxID=633813 RepID=A0A1M6RTT8_9BACT|nr:VWA domain-containing protein [Rhodothermus profundi]SHK35853.1 Ca-activated chloride channel family protein [Rhodothermus profundi]
MNLHWLHPEGLWTLAAVPGMALLWWWAARRRQRDLHRLGDPALIGRLTAPAPGRARLRAALLLSALALLSLALAGPRTGLQPRPVERRGLDLLIALDVSASMLAEDVAPSRLARARYELYHLLERLEGDRVGLILFAGDAFLQCPFTTDYGAVRLFLDVADPSLIPTPGTDYVRMLQVALQAFETPQPEETPRSRVLLVVSDGENHAAGFEQALQQLKEAGIERLAIGVGEPEGAPIPVYRNGRRTGFRRDTEGRVVHTRLEPATLQALAEPDGYLHLGRTGSVVSLLLKRLEGFARTPMATETFETYAERYQWPLALALLLLALEALLPERRRTLQTA